MLKLSLITIAALGLGVLVGCGSGGGGTVIHSPEYKKAIDDYVRNAPVCEDIDGDGKITGEKGSSYCTKTDYAGRFILGNSHPLVLVCKEENNCTDFATGKKFVGKMSAPAGASVLTPLTTLVQEYVRTVKEDNNSAKINIVEVETKIKEKLGIPKYIDIKKFDPIAEVEKHQDENTTDSNESKIASKVLAVQTQVQVILTATAKLTATVQQTTDKTEIVDNMSKVAATTTKILIEAQSDNNTSNDNNQTEVNENNNSQETTSNVLAKDDVLEEIVKSVVTENNESANNQDLNTTVVAQNLTEVLKFVTKKEANISREDSAAVIDVVEELVENKELLNEDSNISDNTIKEKVNNKKQEVKKIIEENKKKAEEEDKKKNKLGSTSLTGAGSQ